MKYYVHVVYFCVWVQTHTPEFPCHTNLFVTSPEPAFPNVRDIAGSPLTFGRISTVLWLSCPRCLLVYNDIFSECRHSQVRTLQAFHSIPPEFSPGVGVHQLGFIIRCLCNRGHVFQKWCVLHCVKSHIEGSAQFIHFCMLISPKRQRLHHPLARKLGFHKSLPIQKGLTEIGVVGPQTNVWLRVFNLLATPTVLIPKFCCAF